MFERLSAHLLCFPDAWASPRTSSLMKAPFLFQPKATGTWSAKPGTKHEYYFGKIRTVAGAIPAHNRLFFILKDTLGAQLERKTCAGYTSDQRVHGPNHNRNDGQQNDGQRADESVCCPSFLKLPQALFPALALISCCSFYRVSAPPWSIHHRGY